MGQLEIPDFVQWNEDHFYQFPQRLVDLINSGEMAREAAWIYIVLTSRANYYDVPKVLQKEVKGRLYSTDLFKGQCVCGRKELAAAGGVTEAQIRKILKDLEANGFITVEPREYIGTVVTVNQVLSERKTRSKRQE